ncbi:MAG: hypothetical protein VYA84_19375 [Planctomycetota bacterium]|nr:hypothetical protein [Planctomycetota bacterium]
MRIFRRRPFNVLIFMLITAAMLVPDRVMACPFCNAVSQTLRQEMAAMDAVVIATAIQSDSDRDKESGAVLMKVETVLKGGELVRAGQKVNAVYYGDVTVGRRFMLSGVDPPEMQWSCLPISERAEKYVSNITQLEDDPLERLRFYHLYLQDKESMLARDAYDEFAIAPYDAVKKLGPEMDHDQLVEWLSDPEMATDRKRLYLTMLGVSGDEKDLPLLEKMLRSTQKSTRGGLDALIACYLTLSGEKGLELVNELFLANKQAPYADTYAAIMAVRFHGTEGDVIPRTALVESLHYVLDRKDLADLVIPDLARWSDWTQIDRLVKLFTDADPENNWVRVPVVNYLRACPLPEAKEALTKLEEIDAESVRRANTFFSIPVPARDTKPDSSNWKPQDADADTDIQVAAAIGSDINRRLPGGPTAGLAAIPPIVVPTTGLAAANPWRLAYVLALALITIMIGQFLLLSGGTQPIPERATSNRR